MHDAMLWKPTDTGTVACGLCAHGCLIASGKRGVCRVRENDGGTLRTRVYGRVVAASDDPVEKKPLYHFLPTSRTFSIATVGCNFRCGFCQNFHISQAEGYTRNDDDLSNGVTMTPEAIVEQAVKQNCKSISFTYTEPTVFFEYAYDTAKLAKEAGLKTVFVSNGYMTPEALRLIAPYLDACNIDLKSFRDDFYKKHCGAALAPVLGSLKTIRELGIWLEVTTLVITGENDSDEELSDIAKFIADDLGQDVPWHVSRFFPQYRMSNHLPTKATSIERAAEIGRKAGLHFVYGGNVDLAQDTLCPTCDETLISRYGFMETRVRGMRDGHCKKCGTAIAGGW